MHKRWKRPSVKPGQARYRKDKQMYRDELRREAKLIVQGRQAWVRDFASLWTRLVARLGIGTKKPSATGLRLH